ncbi:MAG: hypothetical protein AB7G25_03375 [Sphingomonadaceae bacterium]
MVEAASPPANPPAPAEVINKLALDVQDKGYRLQAVLWGIDQSVDISSTEPDVVDALSRCLSLCELALDISKATNELGEQIEHISRQLSKAGEIAS